MLVSNDSRDLENGRIGSQAVPPVDRPQPAGDRLSAIYCGYVLLVLLLAQLLNYADRFVLGVLAEPIKRDLGATDAQLGFLAGTAFILLNGIMGIAFGRMADLWRRNLLLTIGIGLWSVMTALSGLATSFGQLAVARFSVGIGEATAAPTSYSLLADIFPPHRRAIVFAIFLCSTFLGSTISLGVGGWILQNWSQQCSLFALCAVRDWQAAFLVFGLPGLFVAALAAPIGEPSRGNLAELRGRSRPLSAGLFELSLLVPPATIAQLWRIGGGKAVRQNLLMAVIVVFAAGALIRLTQDPAQWFAVGLAAYALISWSQSLAFRDPELFRLTIASPAFRLAAVAPAMLGIVSGAVSFWAIPLASRKLGMTHQEVGAMLGTAMGVGPLVGFLAGGALVDRWRRRTRKAPLYFCLIAVLGTVPALGLMILTEDKVLYSVALGGFLMLAMSPAPGSTALTQDLVLPSMRGRTASMYSAFLTLVAMSLGPYLVGRIADLTGSIGIGLTALWPAIPVAVCTLLVAIRRLPDAYDALARIERDRAGRLEEPFREASGEALPQPV